MRETGHLPFIKCQAVNEAHSYWRNKLSSIVISYDRVLVYGLEIYLIGVEDRA